MKYLITLFLIAQAALMARGALAQAIYGPTGNYLGYSQTAPSGVTNVYNATGQNVQSFQTDNGQTNFYSPQCCLCRYLLLDVPIVGLVALVQRTSPECVELGTS